MGTRVEANQGTDGVEGSPAGPADGEYGARAGEGSGVEAITPDIYAASKGLDALCAGTNCDGVADDTENNEDGSVDDGDPTPAPQVNNLPSTDNLPAKIPGMSDGRELSVLMAEYPNIEEIFTIREMKAYYVTIERALSGNSSEKEVVVFEVTPLALVPNDPSSYNYHAYGEATPTSNPTWGDYLPARSSVRLSATKIPIGEGVSATPVVSQEKPKADGKVRASISAKWTGPKSFTFPAGSTFESINAKLAESGITLLQVYASPKFGGSSGASFSSTPLDAQGNPISTSLGDAKVEPAYSQISEYSFSNHPARRYPNMRALQRLSDGTIVEGNIDIHINDPESVYSFDIDLVFDPPIKVKGTDTDLDFTSETWDRIKARDLKVGDAVTLTTSDRQTVTAKVTQFGYDPSVSTATSFPTIDGNPDIPQALLDYSVDSTWETVSDKAGTKTSQKLFPIPGQPYPLVVIITESATERTVETFESKAGRHRQARLEQTLADGQVTAQRYQDFRTGYIYNQQSETKTWETNGFDNAMMIDETPVLFPESPSFQLPVRLETGYTRTYPLGYESGLARPSASLLVGLGFMYDLSRKPGGIGISWIQYLGPSFDILLPSNDPSETGIPGLSAHYISIPGVYYEFPDEKHSIGLSFRYDDRADIKYGRGKLQNDQGLQADVTPYPWAQRSLGFELNGQVAPGWFVAAGAQLPRWYDNNFMATIPGAASAYPSVIPSYSDPQYFISISRNLAQPRKKPQEK